MTTKPASKKPKTKKTSESKKKDSKSVKESTPSIETETPVVEQTPPVVEQTSTVLETELSSVQETLPQTDEVVVKKDEVSVNITNTLERLEFFEKELKVMKTELRKALKLHEKKSKTKRKSDPNREPSGFAKPSLISDELCKFLNLPKGSQMARTAVTQEVNKYIKAHNLQNPENKKKIKPDKTLCGLLNIDSNSDDLTYFSMQKYLKDHFPKEDTTVVV